MNLEKPEVEIISFENDIITTSIEHDNGFIGSDGFARAIKDIADKYF